MIGTAAKAAIEPVTDVVFGSGRQIVVTRTDGGVSTLRLYEGLPFVFVGGTLHNGDQETIDVPKVVPATFVLDLGKPRKIPHHGHRRTHAARPKPRQLSVSYAGRSRDSPRRSGRLAHQ